MKNLVKTDNGFSEKWLWEQGAKKGEGVKEEWGHKINREGDGWSKNQKIKKKGKRGREKWLKWKWDFFLKLEEELPKEGEAKQWEGERGRESKGAWERSKQCKCDARVPATDGMGDI